MDENEGERINMDLATPPEGADDAAHYPELHAALVRLNQSISGERMPKAAFEQLDAEIQSLLRPEEVDRYLKPLRPHIETDDHTVQYARHFHLTKILWARKGLEKFMKDTGY